MDRIISGYFVASRKIPDPHAERTDSGQPTSIVRIDEGTHPKGRKVELTYAFPAFCFPECDRAVATTTDQGIEIGRGQARAVGREGQPPNAMVRLIGYETRQALTAGNIPKEDPVRLTIAASSQDFTVMGKGQETHVAIFQLELA